MTESSESKPSVVVVGGGYGGINVAKSLDDVADVTLVDPKDSFVHNVASWRALVEPEWLDRIFFPYERLLANGRFLRDSAIEVDGPRVKLADHGELNPDFLVLATGSTYPFPAKTDAPDTETARTRMRAAHATLNGAERVLLIGAGPSGLELAGEIKAVFPEKHVTIADVSDDILVGPFKQELRDELRRQLDELGVELKLGSAIENLPTAEPATAAEIEVTTAAGEKLTADVWYRCFGVSTQTNYLRGPVSESLDGDGYLRVDASMRVRGQDRVFALGDISDADSNMAGMAKYEADVVVANIRLAITGEGEPAEYSQSPPVILVPLGPAGGAGQLPGDDGIAGAEITSGYKGEAMLVESYSSLFDTEPAALD